MNLCLKNKVAPDEKKSAVMYRAAKSVGLEGLFIQTKMVMGGLETRRDNVAVV